MDSSEFVEIKHESEEPVEISQELFDDTTLLRNVKEDDNDEDEQLKAPVAVFIKQEMEWGEQEGDYNEEEHNSPHMEDLNEGKGGSSVSLGEVYASSDTSSEKTVGSSSGQSLGPCTHNFSDDGEDLNAGGIPPTCRTCEKHTADTCSNDLVRNNVNHKSLIICKTLTERPRENRQKKQLNMNPPKQPPKSGAQRAREFRARRKALKNAADPGLFIHDINHRFRCSISPFLKLPKTSTERSKACRERKRANNPPKQPPKSGAQRVREFRARQKALKNAAATGH